MFTRRFTQRVHLAVGVFLFALLLGVSFGAYILWPSRREAGYQPAQPVEFSHKLHAGELEIECLYCHSEAERSAVASVPSVATCMNCHTQVQTKDEAGELTPAMATLLEHWEKKRPIVWNKVHDLADFTYFDHSRHVVADVECQECHGPVETMGPGATPLRTEDGLVPGLPQAGATGRTLRRMPSTGPHAHRPTARPAIVERTGA